MVPRDELISGAEPYSSKWFVDDPVSVEPQVGVRTYESKRALQTLTMNLLGPDAWNMEKDAQELLTKSRTLIFNVLVAQACAHKKAGD